MNNYEKERAKYQPLFESVQNPENWKFPTIPKTVTTLKEASELVNAITFFVGGAELDAKLDRGFTVTSKGYYHYIGA